MTNAIAREKQEGLIIVFTILLIAVLFGFVCGGVYSAIIAGDMVRA